MRKELQIVAIRFSRGSFRIVPPGFEKSHSSEFLQISSDCFRPALWTFPGMRSNIAFILRHMHSHLAYPLQTS